MKSLIQFNVGMILLTQLASANTAAAPKVETWVNPECATGSCEVKGMKLFTSKYNKNRLAANAMAAEIELASNDLVEKYAVVQYIKGCRYELAQDGTVKMGTRSFFKKAGAPFHHKTFEIDSAVDTDPIYGSYPKAGYDDLRGYVVPRNGIYATSNPMTNEGAQAWWGKTKNLIAPKIYINDNPSPAMFEVSETTSVATITNVSLQFKVCLHEISKLPKTVQVPATIMENPINCMEWSSIYTYNKTKYRFEERKEMDPVCL